MSTRQHPDYTSQIKAEMGEVFSVDPKGAILKADSIGSMDAISKLMKGAGFGISKKGIGNVTKRDVMDAFTMLSISPVGTAILAFSVGVDPDAAETAEVSGIKIIRSDIIYKLVDDYKLFVEERDKESAKKIEERITYPGSIYVLPGMCFRASHPAIFGIDVIGGRIKPGYRVMNEEGEIVGKVKGLQNEKTPIEQAKRGDHIAISLDGPDLREAGDRGADALRLRQRGGPEAAGEGLLAPPERRGEGAAGQDSPDNKK